MGRLRQKQKHRTVEEVQEVFLPLTAKNLRTSDKAIPQIHAWISTIRLIIGKRSIESSSPQETYQANNKNNRFFIQTQK